MKVTINGVEKEVSKEEILTLYLNKIYLNLYYIIFK